MISDIAKIIYGYLLDYMIFDIEKINWNILSENSHPDAIKLLMENPEKINWYWLSMNPNAIKLLRENPEKINWGQLSGNSNAIKLLMGNPDKINWIYLSENSHPDAIKLLMENTEKINWNCLSGNSNLFLKNDKFCDEVFKILQDL
jgi:hypothetical protein